MLNQAAATSIERERIGEILDARDRSGLDFAAFILSQSLVQPAALSRAERACSQSGTRLDRVLTELGILSEHEVVRALSGFLDLPVLQSQDYPALAVRPDLIQATFVNGAGLMPISMTDKKVVVAATNPLNNEPIKAIAYLTGLEVDVRISSPTDFLAATKRLYLIESEVGGHKTPRDDIRDDDTQDLQRLRDNASEAPVVKLVNQIIVYAVEARASDIHLEPLEHVMQVRYRIDGVLRTVDSISISMRAAVTSRIKIISKLDIAERRMPQDGRLRVTIRGVDIDFRISTILTARGESIVMRVLDRSRVSLDFEALGFERQEISLIRRLLAQPNGIVLVTGPTGSGKTTSLYACLKELHKEQVKIFTVEDPVEYQLEGINQVQVQSGIGLDFPHALRSILRQDPDVIMIGEIRDAETAKIAVQAALTGHLVLSTLHTNSAASAITRLLDMGIEAFLLASTVRGVIAQRLIRRSCDNCMQKVLEAKSKTAICKCQGSGFFGRSTIAEILPMDADLQKIVSLRCSDAEISVAAIAKGMRTMYQAGCAKAEKGLTTLSEVARVTEVF